MKLNIYYNSLIWGLIAVIVGFLMFFYQHSVLDFAVAMIGFIAIGVGVIQFLVKLFYNREQGDNRFSIQGILAIVFGIVLLVNPEFWTKFLMVIIGIVIIILGINQIATYRKIRQSGFNLSAWFYVFPVLLTISGIITIINPHFLADWIIIFISIWIIAYGFMEIISYFAVKYNNKIE